ncbi:hypothetical protein hrd7_14700 [Leptolinea sp. HRD-7]|jgi:ferredoxin|nr:hypothetical protein hrd7_14700 [Leptolinea sp. HRD-7]
MNILLLFISPGNTTAKVSRALAERFEENGHTVTLLNIGRPGNRTYTEVDPEIFQSADIIGIGGPVFHLRNLPPLEAFLSNMLPLLNPLTKAFLYVTYGGISSGKALLNLSELLDRFHVPIMGAVKLWAPHFYNRMVYPDLDALLVIDRFISGLEKNDYRPIEPLRLRELFSYQSPKVKIAYYLAEIVGESRKLPITFDANRCKGCQRCVAECPVGALRLYGIPVRDKKKCLYCYHCAIVCPSQAVICPTEKVAEMVKTNVKLLGWEQPRNEIFL